MSGGPTPPAGSARRCGNRLLADLAESDLVFLARHCETVELARGDRLFDGEAPMAHVYFPHDAIVSLVAIMADGRSAEMTAIGREGYVDPTALLTADRPLGHYAVQIPGSASRIEVDRLLAEPREAPGLHDRLRRYTEIFLRQSLQLIACSALHSVEARLCRWLLMTQDRLERPGFSVTQDALAELIGVQRSTVSLALRNLQTAGLVATRRGRIEVLRRDGLLEGSCECYGVMQRHYEKLLPTAYG